MRKERRFILTMAIVGTGIVLGLLYFINYIRPKEKITILQKENGHYQLMVQGKPYIIKGVVYSPIPIGQNHQYSFWADPDQPWIEDGRLMQKMGVNTVRFFQPGDDAEQTKKVIGELYQRYGIRTIMGDWMDYWRPGNYADPAYRKELTKRVLEMVRTYKDEEGILLWVLGNENNLSWHSGARVPWGCPEVEEIQDPYKRNMARARLYYSLANQIARQIQRLDPRHPVALGNADTYALEVAGEVCPYVDIIALTAYRGKNFGNLWREVKDKIDKPVFIMEFGCDSFDAKTGEEDQEIQAVFIQSQWKAIEGNLADRSGQGNALGGCIFEWNDEWWKHDEYMPASWYVHNTEGDWSCGGYYFDIGAPNNMNVNEEWWGLVALSPEIEKGLNKRYPRKIYYELQRLWVQE